MSKEATGIDWIKELSDCPTEAADILLGMSNEEIHRVCNLVAHIYLSRSGGITATDSGRLKKSFSRYVQTESGGVYDGLPTNRVFIATVREWIDSLPALIGEQETGREWISVEDRLPEREGKVATLYKPEKYDEPWWFSFSNGRFRDPFNNDPTDDITHWWMPPAPPFPPQHGERP